MEIADVPPPSVKNDNDVLLKVERVGVCGSDVHYYETGRIGSQVVEFPFIVGHECAARVVAVGKDVRRVRAGDEVAVDPAIWCGTCDQCKVGRENTCRNLRFLGNPGQIAGCLCEYIVMPEESCFPTGGVISLEGAALCEPLSVGIYAVERSAMAAEWKAAILGAGPIGLSCLAAVKAAGGKVIYVTDKIGERLKAAGNNGAIWTGNPDKMDIVCEIVEREPLGMDVVFECAGEQETLDEAIELLRPGGRLMIIGIPELERISFVIDKIRRKEITLVNVRRQKGCVQKAIDLIREGKVKVDYMVTHRFGWERTGEVFEMVAGYRDGVIKAMIEF